MKMMSTMTVMIRQTITPKWVIVYTSIPLQQDLYIHEIQERNMYSTIRAVLKKDKRELFSIGIPEDAAILSCFQPIQYTNSLKLSNIIVVVVFMVSFCLRTYRRSFLFHNRFFLFSFFTLFYFCVKCIINLHNSSLPLLLLLYSGWRRQVTKTYATHANTNITYESNYYLRINIYQFQEQ